MSEKNEQRVKPAEDLIYIPLYLEDLDKVTYISASLKEPLKGKLITFLQENNDLFTWTTTGMPGIDH